MTTIDRFVEDRRARWARLGNLIFEANGRVERLAPDDVLELGRLYRSASSDLAVARRDFALDAATERLNDLVAAGHALLRRLRRQRRFTAWDAGVTLVPLCCAAVFFAMFLVLFFATGIGNASTFQMIPTIMRKEMDRLMPSIDATTRQRQAEKESAAITGFTSAIAAFGAFFIPKSYGTSIDLTGGVQAALWGFFIFYVICIVITWAVYTRKGGLLHDIERGGGISSAVQPAE